MDRQVSIRLLDTVTIAGGATYASVPVMLESLRHGSIHLISVGLTSGGTAKLQGSNVLVPAVRKELNNDTLHWGGLDPDDTGWLDLNISIDFPAGVQLNAALPGIPPAGIGCGAVASFDMHWLRLVVEIAGPGPTTLNAWGQFKGGA